MIDDTANSLLSSLSEFELKNNVQSLNIEASPGLDGLTPLWYQMFFPDISTYLLDMYNHFFTTHLIPDNFGSILGILPKNPKSISLSTMRFLSVYNVDFKLFMKVLVSRLTSDITNLFHPKQYGIPGAPPIYLILSQIRDFIQYQQIAPHQLLSYLVLIFLVHLIVYLYRIYTPHLPIWVFLQALSHCYKSYFIPV